MSRIGATSAIMLEVGKLIILTLILGIILYLVFSNPFFGYGQAQATMAANSIAADIYAISIADDGEIIKNFDNEWNVKITDNKIEISYDKAKSKEVKITDGITVNDINLLKVKKLKITKVGNNIEVSKYA